MLKKKEIVIFGFAIFAFLIFLNSSYTATNYYNESLENISVSFDDVCYGKEITFTLYNQTDFFDEDFNVSNTTIIKNARYIVHNSSVNWMGVLQEGKTDGNSQFKVTFPAHKEYLIEIFPHEDDADEEDIKYNTLDYMFLADDCSQFSQLPDVVETSLIKRDERGNETDLLYTPDSTYDEDNIDLSFLEDDEPEPIFEDKEFKVGDIELTFVQTDIVNEGEFNLKVSDKIENLSSPTNTFKILNLSTESKNFSSVNIAQNITLGENDTVEVLKYDTEMKIWTKIDSSINMGVLTFSVDEEGIYAVTKTTPVPEDEIIDTENGGWSMQMYALVIGIPILIIILIFFFSGSKNLKKTDIVKKESEMSTEGNEIKQEDSSPQELEKLHTYNDMYEKSKNYVKKYKNDYDKVQIYSALQNAKIPKDIIDKVFEEQYGSED
jgi:hypothetical protein